MSQVPSSREQEHIPPQGPNPTIHLRLPLRANTIPVIGLTEPYSNSLNEIIDLDNFNDDGRRQYPNTARSQSPTLQTNTVSTRRNITSPREGLAISGVIGLSLNHNGKRTREDKEPTEIRKRNTRLINEQRNSFTRPVGESLGSLSNVGTQSVDDTHTEAGVELTRTKRVTRIANIPRAMDPSKPQVSHVIYNGNLCKAGKSVELRDGAFMRIKGIYSDKSGGHILVGNIFTRLDRSFLQMPKQQQNLNVWVDIDENPLGVKLPLCYKGRKILNELVQRVMIKEGEHKGDCGLWGRPIDHVIGEVSLRVIDSDDPRTFFCADDTDTATAPIDVEDASWLTCRWKDVIVYDGTGTAKEHRLERIPRREADELGQEYTRHHPREPTTLRSSYTFVDAFCSAGGVSTGARRAGLTIIYAFDKDEKKIATYEANFGNLNGGALAIGIDAFIAFVEGEGIKVDILHLSPPCQPFSPANSTPNEQKNEMNQPPILGCGELIKCLNPRVVTVEQTPGIRGRHNPWFEALIGQFTDLGYAVSWKTVKCSDFGVPQTRERLIIIAAAPGENLPRFPEPTYAPGQCSINQTLRELEQFIRGNEITHHNLAARRMFTPRDAYDGNILARTITTGGGQNYYPNGLRDFTIREYASLQTFPFTWRFGRGRDGQEFSQTELKTQIGNAVPPALASAIYSTIVRSLSASDERARTLRRARNEDVVMVL